MARTLFSRKKNVTFRWAENPLSEEAELTPRFSSLRSVASPNARTHVLSLSSSSDDADDIRPGEYWSLLGALGFRDRRLEDEYLKYLLRVSKSRIGEPSPSLFPPPLSPADTLLLLSERTLTLSNLSARVLRVHTPHHLPPFFLYDGQHPFLSGGLVPRYRIPLPH